jgi:hypothetical protein
VVPCGNGHRLLILNPAIRPTLGERQGPKSHVPSPTSELGTLDSGLRTPARRRSLGLSFGCGCRAGEYILSPRTLLRRHISREAGSRATQGESAVRKRPLRRTQTLLKFPLDPSIFECSLAVLSGGRVPEVPGMRSRLCRKTASVYLDLDPKSTVMGGVQCAAS